MLDYLKAGLESADIHDYIGMAIVLVIVAGLYNAHRNHTIDFNIFDLIMENGHVSRLAFVFLGSWTLLTWIMVKMTLKGTMTEGYFTAYMAGCFAPIIAKLFSGNPPQPPKETT